MTVRERMRSGPSSSSNSSSESIRDAGEGTSLEHSASGDALEMSNADNSCKRVRNDAALCMTGTHVDIWRCSISAIERRHANSSRRSLREDVTGRQHAHARWLRPPRQRSGFASPHSASCWRLLCRSRMELACLLAWMLNASSLGPCHAVLALHARCCLLAPSLIVQDLIARCSYCFALTAACC
jgi:hypothetical protein